MVILKPGFKKIVEEKQAQDDKHNEKLHQDDDPKLLPNRHASEAVVVEIYDFQKQVVSP